jgi:hypothetical protein
MASHAVWSPPLDSALSARGKDRIGQVERVDLLSLVAPRTVTCCGFKVFSAVPIVLCPGGQLLRNPGEDELARCLGLLVL